MYSVSGGHDDCRRHRRRHDAQSVGYRRRQRLHVRIGSEIKVRPQPGDACDLFTRATLARPKLLRGEADANIHIHLTARLDRSGSRTDVAAPA